MVKITAEHLLGVPYVRLGIPGRKRRQKKEAITPRPAPSSLAAIDAGVFKRAVLIGPMPAPVKVRGHKARPGRFATIGEIIASK